MSKAKAVVVHRRDPNNVGDFYSDPLRYFLKEDEYVTVDIDNLGREPFPDNLPIFFGGGGLLCNEFFGHHINYMFDPPDVMQLNEAWDHRWRLQNPKYDQLYKEFNNQFKDMVVNTIKKVENMSNSDVPKVIWGAGHNVRNWTKENDDSEVRYPKKMKNFDHIGIRDYWNDDWAVRNPHIDWVPCASCMHPAFDKKYPIKNDVIIFEHKKQLIKGSEFGTSSIPRFVNSGSNIEQTVEILGSANTIITNSYHGAYWGTILGKKVIVIGPWSSKFYSLKHKPHLRAKMMGWEDIIDEVPFYKTALEESRIATNRYWKKVKSVL